MSKTFNLLPFDIHSQEKDAVVLRDYTNDNTQISFKRTAPKRVKEFAGMEKTEVKQLVTAPDGSILAIQTVSTSIYATAPASVRSSLNATTVAVLNDQVYTDLISDQRLPLSI